MPDNTGMLYYVSFLFEEEKDRDRAYGRELARVGRVSLPNIIESSAEYLSDVISAIKASSAPQEPRQMQGWEILYRQKSFDDSGYGIGYAIQMVVGVPEEIDLETLLRGGNAVGECRRVSEARILLTTDDSYARSELEYLSQELQAVSRETETPHQSDALKIVDTERTDWWATICSIGSNKPGVMKHNRAYLAGDIRGAVRDVLHIYDVMKGMELRLTNKNLIFV